MDARRFEARLARLRSQSPVGRAYPRAAARTGEVRQPSRPTNPVREPPGFFRSDTTAEIAAHGYALTPGRYVGAEKIEADGEPFEEKMPRLVAELHAQFAESARLEKTIRANLKGLGYGG